VVSVSSGPGNAIAQYNLGISLVKGRSYQEGLRWLLLAANQNFADAQFALGLVFARHVSMGQNAFADGYVPNPAEAVKWYRRAADQGHARAQERLGHMYLTGDGVLKDEAWAAKWYGLAAHQGLDVAQWKYGILHAQVAKDHFLAYVWLSLAAAKQSKRAIEDRDKVEKHLTPAQVAKAQKLVRQWKPGKKVQRTARG
jgi:TPR repeat protein